MVSYALFLKGTSSNNNNHNNNHNNNLNLEKKY